MTRTMRMMRSRSSTSVIDKTKARHRVWVVKIGSALITGDGQGIRRDRLASWCRQVGTLADHGVDVVLVSSGAVAEGCLRLGFTTRPDTVHELQAAAAVGQTGLIEAYETALGEVDRRAAMVLLTHDDLADRERYLNARTTLRTLLDLGVVPIINENDSVATDEIKLGDNDTLAALVANLLGADVLAILTDQAGLHRADPRLDPTAPVVDIAPVDDPRLDEMAGEGAGRLGRGGMVTKIQAARSAARSGTDTVIVDGRQPDVLVRLAHGETLGTRLTAGVQPMVARKRWIAGVLHPKGDVQIDTGAVDAVRQRGVSVLPVGVVAVRGAFHRGDVVRVVDDHGIAIAKGLVNYDIFETQKILGRTSAEIESLLGYLDEAELIHRDNLVVL